MNLFLLLVVLGIAGAVLWRRGSYAYALLCVLLAGFPAWALLQQIPWWGLIQGGDFADHDASLRSLSIFADEVIPRFTGQADHPAESSAALVTRWSSQSRRKAGVASTFDVLRHASARAMRQRAATVRPSLAELGRWARWRLPAVEVAIELCRTGWLTMWSPIEDVVMIFGGPRTGKTGWLAGRILDAPGAVLVTSTRTDLYELCAPLRARRGPVYVFNPVGLGGKAFASTITFDPLTGCTDPVTAAERASDLIAAVSRAGGGGDREFWNSHARRVLAGLLHAAALGGKSIHDVGRWVAEVDDAAREVPPLLRRSTVQAFEQDLAQFLGTNTNTRTSITSTVAPALGWLNHPDAERSAKAGPDGGFDVERLLAERATVFLLGGEETQTGPLVCALTGHIAREARALAAVAPKGRLDPNLTLALDEAALISPVPLESWTADMGGRGVTIIAAFQSRAQLLARWGEHNTATILNNCGAVMVFGGTRDRDDLQFWSTLAGDRDEPTLTTDMHGRVASRTTRRVPVLPAAQLANLPTGRVMLIRRGLAPVIGRVQMAWKRRDVRWRAFRLAHPALAARLARWAATAHRWWSRLTGPVVAALRWIGALVGRFWQAACAAIAWAWRWIWEHLTPTSTHDVLIDLDAPTVELPVQASHTSNAHTPGGAP